MATILLIDDDDLLREALKETLERAGFEVLDAPNGKVGLELFKKSPSDLVITDIFMPQQDGIATINQLIKLNPQVKIIAISGGGAMLASNDYLQHAEIFGAVKTFQKPIDPQELITVINECLKA